MTVAAVFFNPFFHQVTFGFVTDGGEQGLSDFIITAAPAKHGAEIGLVVVQQAGSEHAFRGQAQPVTAVTEMVADGTDKAQFTLRVLANPEHTCRAIRPATGYRDQLTFSTDALLNLI